MEVAEKYWSITEIEKLFQIPERVKSRKTLYNAEERGEIPKAERIQRGKVAVRQWEVKHLPIIGERFGFLGKPKSKKIICVYTPKGGVLKTTLSYNLARVFAINGIKTLVIGLDVQCSISDLLSNEIESESIEEIRLPLSLWDASKSTDEGGASIDDVILQSDLPTLHYIPESIQLTLLEQRIRDKNKREYFLSNLISPLQDKYDVIIFDNAPSWSFLIQNSLMASSVIISPIGCDIGTFKSVSLHIGILNQFKDEMSPPWENFIVVPTLLEKTKLSDQIQAQYKTLYPELITRTSIRRAVKGQESVAQKYSVIESDSSSPLANDYYEVIKEVWERIQGSK